MKQEGNSQTIERNKEVVLRSFDQAFEELLKNHGSETLELIDQYREKAVAAISSESTITDEFLKNHSKTKQDSSRESESTSARLDQPTTTPIKEKSGGWVDDRSYSEVVSPQKDPEIIEEKEGGKETRSRSGSTNSSNAEVETLRERKILVTHRTKIEKTSNDRLRTVVKFAINSDQRAKTYLGDSQGDHTSSYLFLTYSLLSGARNERGIDEAIINLKRIGNQLLNREGKNELDSISSPTFLSRDARQIALNHIPQKSGIKLDDRSELGNFPLRQAAREDLLYAKISKKAEHLSDITTCVLNEVQKDPLATVYSKGKIKRDREGRIVKSDDEGPVVKKSARGLMLLDTLCSLYETRDDNNFDEKLGNFIYSLKARSGEESEEEHLARYGFNSWYNDNGKTADAVKKELRQIAHKGKKDSSINHRDAQKEFIKALIDDLLEIDHQTHKVSEFMGGLFDYDRTVEFDCKRAFPISDESKENIRQRQKPKQKERLLTASIVEQVQEKFDSRVESKHCDFTNISMNDKGDISGNIFITRNDPETLAKLVVRHENIMDIFCHNIQQHIGDVKYNHMKRQFLEEEVFDKSGWNDLKNTSQVAINRERTNQQQIGSR